MQSSWKDELVLLVFLVPVVMCFVPGMETVVMNGFNVLGSTPEWYQYVVLSMVIVIYGLRGLFTKFLAVIKNKKVL